MFIFGGVVINFSFPGKYFCRFYH